MSLQKKTHVYEKGVKKRARMACERSELPERSVFHAYYRE